LQNFDENPNTRPGGTPEEQALPSNRAEGAMTLKLPPGLFYKISVSHSFAYSGHFLSHILRFTPRNRFSQLFQKGGVALNSRS
jgi:hypothetical protein